MPEAGHEPASTGVIHSLDEPLEWRADRPLVILSGWCLGVDDAVTMVEARVDGAPHPVTWGLPRPDVAAHHPEMPGAGECGFRVALALLPGRHEIRLRALGGTAPAVEFLNRSIDVGRSALQGNVETPGAAVPAGRVHVTGWCFHPQSRIARVRLRARGEMHDCRHGLPRPDVAGVFADLALAAESGFELRVDFPPGRHSVDLVAELDSGEVLEVAFARRIVVLSDARWARSARGLRGRMTAVAGVARLARDWVSRRGHLPRPRDWPRLATKAWRLVAARQSSAFRGLPGGFKVPAVADRYDAWMEQNRWSERRAAWLATRLRAAPARPTLSIVMPVYRPDRKWLDHAIESVRTQVEPRWELCIADDASGDRALASHLSALAASDPRIKVAFRAENGNISRATNSAAKLATGDFLLFLDQDDLLPPDALGEIALALAAAPDADILYTDDDKIDVDGRRYAPQFKPDWSPELLLSYMYFSHAFVVRRALFAELLGFRPGFEGSQDYDFALRASEHARRIVHLPLVLYHWRATPGSTAASGEAKPASFDAGIRAVDEALSRRGSRGRAVRPGWAEQAGLGIYAHEFPDDGPRVALLIPTRNQRDVLARCIDSLARTSYRNYEIVVIDNESDDPATCNYFALIPHRVLRIANPGPRFSFAHINNEAARRINADYVLFLNDDTEVRDPRWLSRMMGYAQLPGVGAVGARLLYPDGRIQHAGVLHGYYGGLPGPAFKLAPESDHGYLSYAMVARNYGAVTAACMLTPRRRFLDMGGFDEERFAVAFNDVDYGFRLEAAGLRCVYAPGATLVHHEGLSRGFADDPREAAAYRAKHGGRVERYYNPNLSLDDERFAIAPRRAFAAAPPGPIRTLMCAFNLNWEGASNSQFEMAAELKRRGIVEPIVYAPVDGPLRAAYEEEGIRVHVAPHPLADVSTSMGYEAAQVRFCAWIRSLDVRVVYGNTLQTFYAIDAAHRLGLPSVWNPRESEPWNEYFLQYPDALAARALACYAYPYRIVFVAHATAAGSAAIDTRHNFTVIHNGLDRRRLEAAAASVDRDAARGELGLGQDDVALLLVGTVCARKGQHDLARALALLPPAAAARVRACFVGDRDSDYSRALHDLVAMLPSDRRDRVTLVPETGDVARYFIAADLFVCTSRVESYPRVILEAMAHGLPVVTTPVFGIREQVREDINGVFYEPGDAQALSEAVARLVGDDALRARLAGNAVPVLSALTDFDAMVEQYGRIFIEAAAP
jgi:GT2 family glycosyltransferase/glycosyltransferase involved in cell wall biosynthesis